MARLVLPAQPVPLKQPGACGKGEAALPVLSPTFSELPQRLPESMSLASPATGVFPAPCWVILISVSPEWPVLLGDVAAPGSTLIIFCLPLHKLTAVILECVGWQAGWTSGCLFFNVMLL